MLEGFSGRDGGREAQLHRLGAVTLPFAPPPDPTLPPPVAHQPIQAFHLILFQPEFDHAAAMVHPFYSIAVRQERIMRNVSSIDLSSHPLASTHTNAKLRVSERRNLIAHDALIPPLKQMRKEPLRRVHVDESTHQVSPYQIQHHAHASPALLPRISYPRPPFRRTHYRVVRGLLARQSKFLAGGLTTSRVTLGCDAPPGIIMTLRLVLRLPQHLM